MTAISRSLLRQLATEMQVDDRTIEVVECMDVPEAFDVRELRSTIHYVQEALTGRGDHGFPS